MVLRVQSSALRLYDRFNTGLTCASDKSTDFLQFCKENIKDVMPTISGTPQNPAQ